MKNLLLCLLLGTLTVLAGCTPDTSSNAVQAQAQEAIEQQSDSAVGMPAIHNFREKRLLREIYEMRDQDALITYTYIQSSYSGKFILLGQTIGYGIPYATQFTNPQASHWHGSSAGYVTLPQADPNGLFSPADAEGTWILMADPKTGKPAPLYIEQRILVSPFPLSSAAIEAAGK